MEELSALVETAGGETVGIVLQNRPSPDPRTFIGEGKVAEVQLYCENTGATMVIFDNDLSPSQMRVLTELLGVQVLDRCGLILDIFAQRAKTKEGRLQVELAQYQYLLPRLTGMWTHLERQAGTSGKGPIGSKGPGETQLETDRRHIRRKIDKLREDLEEVRRVRSTQRQRRQKNEIPVVAIVGYTNAGKSTLLNHLTGAGIPANNRLFDTLDTTSRLLTVSDTCLLYTSPCTTPPGGSRSWPLWLLVPCCRRRWQRAAPWGTGSCCPCCAGRRPHPCGLWRRQRLTSYILERTDPGKCFYMTVRTTGNGPLGPRRRRRRQGRPPSLTRSCCLSSTPTSGRRPCPPR